MGRANKRNLTVKEILRVDSRTIFDVSYRTDKYRRGLTLDNTMVNPSGRYLAVFGRGFMFGQVVKDEETITNYLSKHFKDHINHALEKYQRRHMSPDTPFYTKSGDTMRQAGMFKRHLEVSIHSFIVSMFLPQDTALHKVFPEYPYIIDSADIRYVCDLVVAIKDRLAAKLPNTKFIFLLHPNSMGNETIEDKLLSCIAKEKTNDLDLRGWYNELVKTNGQIYDVHKECDPHPNSLLNMKLAKQIYQQLFAK